MPDDFDDALTAREPSDPSPELSEELLYDHDERETRPDGRSNGNEDSVEHPTYVSAQASSFDPDAGGYPQYCEPQTLGHADAIEPQMLTLQVVLWLLSSPMALGSMTSRVSTPNNIGTVLVPKISLHLKHKACNSLSSIVSIFNKKRTSSKAVTSNFSMMQT